MKKGIIVVLVLVVIGAIAMAGNSESDEKEKAIVSVEEGESSGSREKSIVSKSSSEEKNKIEKGEVTDADKVEVKVAEKEVTKEEEKPSESIKEQVLFEQNDVKVTATEYVVDSIWGEGIKMLIENNSTKDITLSCNALIVNDYMISDLFVETVAAGKKTYETMYLYNNQLERIGIDNVGKIEVYFHLYDDDTYETIADINGVTIKTSEFDKMDVNTNDLGVELYNAEGIRIVGKYADEDSFWGKAIILYIENNSGKNCTIHCDDLSINGFMVTPYFYCTVYNGKKAVDDITIMQSELDENNIKSVDEVELKFRITDEDYINSIETDAITFSTK